MSVRMTNILGYLTLIALLGAIWVLFGEDPRREQGARGGKLFPSLDQRLDTLSTITLSAADGQTVTLIQGDTGWTVQERDGFPADKAKVQALVRGLYASTRREPKTANEDRLQAIGLGDMATTVTLLDTAGNTVLSIDLGKRSEGATGRSLTYVWKEGDTRSWLVSDIAVTDTFPAWWLDMPGLSVVESDIISFTNSMVTLTRAEDGSVILSDAKDGETLQPAYQMAAPMRALATLEIQDVLRMNNPLTDPVASFSATLAGGDLIIGELYQMQGAVWLSVMAPDGVVPMQRGWLYQIRADQADALMAPRDTYIQPAGAPDAE